MGWTPSGKRKSQAITVAEEEGLAKAGGRLSLPVGIEGGAATAAAPFGIVRHSGEVGASEGALSRAYGFRAAPEGAPCG